MLLKEGEMARVLEATSSVTYSFWHLFDGISRAMANFSDNVRALREYKFDQ